MRTGRRASVLPMRLAATLGLIALVLEKTARERSGDPAPTAKFHTLASVLGNRLGNSVLGQFGLGQSRRIMLEGPMAMRLLRL
jgi:hypothetical protein